MTGELSDVERLRELLKIERQAIDDLEAHRDKLAARLDAANACILQLSADLLAANAASLKTITEFHNKAKQL